MKWDHMPFRRRPSLSEATGAFPDCYLYVAADGRWRLAWPGLPGGACYLLATTEEEARTEAEHMLRDAVSMFQAALAESKKEVET